MEPLKSTKNIPVFFFFFTFKKLLSQIEASFLYSHVTTSNTIRGMIFGNVYSLAILADFIKLKYPEMIQGKRKTTQVCNFLVVYAVSLF